jgi:hypothetical protein
MRDAGDTEKIMIGAQPQCLERGTHIVDDTNTNVYTAVVSNGVIFVGYTHFIGIPHLQVNGGVAALDVASGRAVGSEGAQPLHRSVIELTRFAHASAMSR